MASEYDELKSVAERLIWARLHFASQRQDIDVSSPRKAAKHFGWPVENLRKRESGERGNLGLPEPLARMYARGYGVNWVWLATGQGHPLRGHEVSNLDPEDAALARRLLDAAKRAS